MSFCWWRPSLGKDVSLINEENYSHERKNHDAFLWDIVKSSEIRAKYWVKVYFLAGDCAKNQECGNKEITEIESKKAKTRNHWNRPQYKNKSLGQCTNVFTRPEPK